MAPTKDKWVRRFVITETARHKKGFTIYKVTSVIFLKVAPEALSKVSVWKRYNDFRKLHCELGARHASLRIKEPFPPFPKPKFFGRFEAEVIEERRQCAIKLLDFIAKHISLFTSDVFVKFFETSHSNDYLTDCSQSVSSDTSEDDRSTVPTDSESVNSSTSQNSSLYVSESILNGANNLPKFVCTEQIRPTVVKGIFQSGSKVGSETGNARSILKDSRAVAGADMGQGALGNGNRCSENKSSGELGTKVDSTDGGACATGDRLIESNNNYSSDNGPKRGEKLETIFQACDQNEIDKEDGPMGDFVFCQNNAEANQRLSQCASSASIHDGSDLPNVQEDSGHYILVAAAHMSAGFRHEAIVEYGEAFTQYKLGISNLLNGVQSDPDLNRRLTIKEKISKYLTRAERLYNRHLNCNVLVLSKPVTELQNYKVLRVIGSVMLVRDTLRECNRVVKTIQKPAGNRETLSDYILRGKVPYMVRLYACIETETTVFLVLQYASGGKLWEYIKSYYKAYNKKLRCYEKGHTRSTSCDAIIQSDSDKKPEISHRKEFEVKQRSIDIEVYKTKVENDLKNIETNEVNSEDSLRKLEEEFGANSKYNKDLPTPDLLEKAQKLLQSVNATLKKSNSIASRLNESEKLMYCQDKTNLKQVLTKNCIPNSLDYLANTDKQGDIFYQSRITDIRDNEELAQDAMSMEQSLSETSKNIDDNDNTEDSYDLCELSTCDSFPDLNLTPSLISKANKSPNTLADESNRSEVVEGDKILETFSLRISTEKADSSRNTRPSYGGSNCLNKFQPQASEDSGVEMEEELWKLPEGTIRHWAAEILLTLEALHQQDIVISDLRPDNILLGDGGHVAMSYIVPLHNAELRQPRKPYSAPELCMFLPMIPASPAVDVWSFGVLLYELFTGIQFQSRHPGPFHSHSLLSIPDELSSNAKSLLSDVLKYQPEDRLTIPEIKRHPFFSAIDWSNMLTP